MYFSRTLEDWINFKIDDRTKYDLSISSGLALLAAQKVVKEKKTTNFNDKVFFRKVKQIVR
jgi:putative intracellular protease/amidase